MRKIIKINKTKIEYITKGEGDPFLFVHGGTVSYRTYTPFIDKLSERFKVVALSLPGAGRSSTIPLRWTYDDYGHLLYEFTKYLKIEKPILGGHSYGGAVSVISKALYPDHFSNLVLLAPAGIKVPSPKAAIGRVIQKKIHSFIKGDRYLKKDLLINNVLHLHDYARIGRSFSKMSLDEYMQQIQDRVLLFWGKNDLIFNDQYAAKYTDQFKNKKTFWLNDGHGFVNNNRDYLVDKIISNL